jgi:hypothetical protein
MTFRHSEIAVAREIIFHFAEMMLLFKFVEPWDWNH